jgi:hypothetical protein
MLVDVGIDYLRGGSYTGPTLCKVIKPYLVIVLVWGCNLVSDIKGGT